MDGKSRVGGLLSRGPRSAGVGHIWTSRASGLRVEESRGAEGIFGGPASFFQKKINKTLGGSDSAAV